MIKHIVLFKMKEKKDIPRAAEALNALKGRIDGMTDLEVGVDFLHSERSFDLALTTMHIDRAALDFYQAHPLHQPVKKLMAEIRESSVACDYEVAK